MAPRLRGRGSRRRAVGLVRDDGSPILRAALCRRSLTPRRRRSDGRARLRVLAVPGRHREGRGRGRGAARTRHGPRRLPRASRARDPRPTATAAPARAWARAGRDERSRSVLRVRRNVRDRVRRDLGRDGRRQDRGDPRDRRHVGRLHGLLVPHARSRAAAAHRLVRSLPARCRSPGERCSLKPTSEQFREHVDEALADWGLRAALAAATGRFVSLRQDAFAAFPEGGALRDQARTIKEEAIARLDEHLEQLAFAVEARGGNVHFAADADAACRMVIEIARQRGVTLAVKSKSMTTEEIALNEALEHAGIRVVETDLGEFIIQLAVEGPSHLIAPAVHKTREQVATLFREKLGYSGEDSVPALCAFAREFLRGEFVRAGMGVSGVNFAVAETGTIAIVENEGNARLTTTLPPVHVAIMGMEKVVPRLADLAVFLRILARSATGQKMSSYVSLLTGPRREREEDGAQEFHLVILDNGRSRLLADPELRESLYCIRCGACLNVCPVYRAIGGHAYGWVYPGPIGAVLTPAYLGESRAPDLPFASTLCGACADVCPVKIALPHRLLDLRARVVAEKKRTKGNDAKSYVFRAWAWLLTHPSLYRASAKLARFALKPMAKDGRIDALPGRLAGWTRTRDFPLPAAEPFHARWRKRWSQPSARDGTPSTTERTE
ncbi:MAG: iron-sulfur cluster-binding protein [Planctomycetes bacterium]|nr:iron-sulfur cluster-binding protein [Planctomycetota bacterium]MBI3843340.1 iron-sulfur cluster-binding protein [Planctomycetota bacterium]